MAMLIATFMGGVGFMVIKGIEYKAKWDHHLLPGSMNAFYYEQDAPKYPDKLQHTIAYIDAHNAGSHAEEHADDGHGEHAEDAHAGVPDDAEDHAATAEHTEPAVAEVEHDADMTIDPEAEDTVVIPAAFAPPADVSLVAAPARPVAGVLDEAIDEAGVTRFPSAAHTQVLWDDLTGEQQKKVHIFFGIYFMMTGLHGLHVLIGMAVIFWLILKARKRTFGKDYFTPVDIGGLYWHLVDLIWIFLFPLLYLIH
jgi:cytochrome c oxidase subunit 3